MADITGLAPGGFHEGCRTIARPPLSEVTSLSHDRSQVDGLCGEMSTYSRCVSLKVEGKFAGFALPELGGEHVCERDSRSGCGDLVRRGNLKAYLGPILSLEAERENMSELT